MTMWKLSRLALVGACLLIAPKGIAASLSTVETPCSPGLRCFNLEPVERLTVTPDNPDMEWTFTPILPDLTNWQPVNVYAGGGSVGYGFIFSAPRPFVWALAQFSFTDSQGRVFIDTLVGSAAGGCFDGTGVFDGKWICSDGGAYAGTWTFGEPPNFSADHPLDPMLPSLDGPRCASTRTHSRSKAAILPSRTSQPDRKTA